MAAAACLAPSAMADPLPAHSGRAAHAAVTDAASYTSVSTAHVLAASRQAAGHRAASAQAVKYTVRPGDSLSAIAGRVYHNPDAWPVLYWANHSQIRWANIITAGQVLKVPAKPAKIPSAPGLLGPAAPAPGASAPAPAEATAVSPAYAPAAATPRWRATRAARQAARSVSASWPPSPAGTRRS